MREGFTDYSIIIGEGTDFPLRGMLSMPDDAISPVPGVVIVAGSGQHNMDGNVAGNTPYRDIADHLASHGIAVIRHDKRTFTHRTMMDGSLTVWDEAIEDAILAAEFLRADPRIYGDRIYIIGHSLGGMLAPRIHAEGGNFAGLILMAATPRCLTEVTFEQLHSYVSLAVETGVHEEADLTDFLTELYAVEKLVATIVDMSDEEAKELHVPMFGASAYYLKDLKLHPFEDFIPHISDLPTLVLQGGRDFQVLADVDFVLLQELFAERDDVMFILYENLNHLFVPTTATNFLEHAEGIIMNPGRVYTQALRDIVDWIMQ